MTVLLSGSGSNLAALLERAAAPDASFSVRAVISDRADAFGLERARAAGIAAQCVARGDWPDKATFQRALRDAVLATTPDLVVLAGFMRILDSGFVDAFAGRLINIHPSLLPKYRGLDTYARALAAGDQEHGTSVHYVTGELDGGPLIAQCRVPIRSGDDVATLRARTQSAEHQLYPAVVQALCAGETPPLALPALVTGAGTTS